MVGSDEALPAIRAIAETLGTKAFDCCTGELRATSPMAGGSEAAEGAQPGRDSTPTPVCIGGKARLVYPTLVRKAFLSLLAGCISESHAAPLPEPAPIAPAALVDAGTPPVVPWGTVGREGGTVQRLWFALTGDTRPGECDDTQHYPAPVIDQIARSMKALHVQFGLDLGDHMFVCNGSASEAKIQMGEYMGALAGGPQTFWMTMGNHECGHLREWGVCLPGLGADANYDVYMSALKRPLPWYFTDVKTSQELDRFVFVADDAWCREQADWLEATLTDADTHARYTIISRHHPMDGSRMGRHPVVQAILRHKYSLLLTAHLHTYRHDPDSLGGRAVIVGVGGGPSDSPPGFATVLQNKDGTLSFVMRDIEGNPVGEPWSVTPQ